jgi:Fe-S cluster biosynthesis and repair protein YggX
MSMRLIAHYGLNMGNPLHRQQLRQVMCDFLDLPSAPEEG